jgi:tetratricopeptide (TPR) repeat protein
MNGFDLEPCVAAYSIADIAHIEQLCDIGRFQDAYEQALRLGPLEDWRGPQALALASRLLRHLGAQRLARVFAWRAWRADRHGYAGCLVYGRELLSRRGHFFVWRWIHQLAPLHGTIDEEAEWLSFIALQAAHLRDFGRARETMERALELSPGQAWLHLEQAFCLEQEDRYAEALQVCERVLETWPDYRAAQQQAAAMEMLLGRDAEAMSRLQRAAVSTQSAALLSQLGGWLIEHERLDEAEQTLRRAEACSLLNDAGLKRWYAARYCDIACLRGDHESGRMYAEQAGPGFYQAVAERLQAAQGQRRLLRVSFVRQHHVTCGPATLTAIARFWGRGVEHLQVAEEICYDGTPHYAERNWAERNGWLAREFTVDWATCVALIERGIPFTLTTQTTGSGHLQAVVGYDTQRGTLLLRDPSQRDHNELLAESFFAERKAFGPRGMLMLPAEESARLEGLELPDAAQWDAYHAVIGALEMHHREQAREGLALMLQQWPEDRLTVQAQRALAGYDGSEAGRLAATEKLLRMFPDDASLRLSKASSLEQLATRADQQEWYAQIAADSSDVWVLVRYAHFLAEDGSRRAEAQALFQRVLNCHSTLATAWQGLASLVWGEGRQEDATALYRVAACLDEFNEGHALAFFRASRWLRQSEVALDFLRQRAERLGGRNSGPVISLCQLLDELERLQEMFALLEQGLKRLPDDPELLLYATDAYGRYGRLEEAEACLRRAESRCQRGRWVRAHAWHLQRSGANLDQALREVGEALEQEPLNLGLQRLYADLLQKRQGRATALAHLAGMVARYPHHCGVAEMHYSWLSAEPLVDKERALRHLLAINPAYPWALRELAVNLANQARGDEALEQVEAALGFEPRSSTGASTMAFVRLRRGEREVAQQYLRLALERSVDNDYAIDTLLELACSREESQEALAFIANQLKQQVTFGDGLLGYQRAAGPLLDGATILQTLQEALTQRPDLWQAWLAVAMQQRACQQQEAACALLISAINRFPLLPRLYLELAQLHLAAKHFAECREVLERSFAINPVWVPTVRTYLESLLEEPADLAPGLALLERALLREPENSALRVWQAYLFGRVERFAEQREALEQALKEEPEHQWAWTQLHELDEREGTPEGAAALARQLVELRAGDPDAWQALADHSSDEERGAALREALRLAPFGWAAGEGYLKWLIEQRRFDEVGAWLDGAPWHGKAPVEFELYRALAERAAGRNREAVGVLRQLLVRAENFFEGWRLLADYHDEDGEAAPYVEAARQMVALCPQLAMAHGFLGHALCAAAQAAQAEASFERAVELDAEYPFAWFQLFDLRMSRQAYIACEEMLHAMAVHATGPALDLRMVRVGLAEDRFAAHLREGLQRLARSEANIDDVWMQAEELVLGARREHVLVQVLEACLEDGSANSVAARAWLRRQAGALVPGGLLRAFKRMLPQDHRGNLALAMLGLLADRPADSAVLRSTCYLLREAMASDIRIWSHASYALSNHGEWYTLTSMLSDWHERDDAPAWALDNLSLGLRELARDEEAGEVSRRALALDSGNLEARLWLSVDHAISDDLGGLAGGLASIPVESLRPYYACLWHLAEGYREARECGHARHAQGQFELARRQAPDNHAVYRRLRRRLAAALARHQRSWLERLWWRIQLY